MLAVSALLTSSNAVVAFVTHSFRVERFVRVGAIGDLPLAYLFLLFLLFDRLLCPFMRTF